MKCLMGLEVIEDRVIVLSDVEKTEETEKRLSDVKVVEVTLVVPNEPVLDIEDVMLLVVVFTWL